MKDVSTKPARRLRCAIYTRKSSEEGLDMEFNSLDAQREAHRAQLERYSNLLARFGPEPVRAALYFPTLTQFVELN